MPQTIRRQDREALARVCVQQMGAKMRVLRTNLSPGMILDSDAMDRQGRMLISANTELTDRLLEVLETTLIPILHVTDDSFEEHNCAPELPPLTREQEREITGRFRHVNLDDDFARAVFEECLNHARECSATDPKATE